MRTALIASFAALAAAVEPQMDRGQILTWKELKAPETKDILVVGKPFEVTYFVFNMGAFAMQVSAGLANASFSGENP